MKAPAVRRTAAAALGPVAGVGLVLCLTALTAWAQAPGADPAAIERERIAAEREAAMRRFNAEEAACSQRFAVTPCVDEVRERRRAALAAWRERELRLDEADRRERARRRLEEIAARAAAAASAPAPASTPMAAPAAPAPNGGAAKPAARAASASAPAASQPAGAFSRAPADGAAAPRRALAAQQRRQEADDARRRIEEREADRAARGRVTAPLPVPPGASAPQRP